MKEVKKKTGKSKKYWKCKCECGNLVSCTSSELVLENKKQRTECPKCSHKRGGLIKTK